MKPSRVGSFYTYALVAVALGYVILLVVLLNDGSQGRTVGRVPEDRAVAIALNPGVNAGYQYGLKVVGRNQVSCEPAPATTWACEVTGFADRNGASCTVKVKIDATIRRAFASADGKVCTGSGHGSQNQ